MTAIDTFWVLFGVGLMFFCNFCWIGVVYVGL